MEVVCGITIQKLPAGRERLVAKTSTFCAESSGVLFAIKLLRNNKRGKTWKERRYMFPSELLRNARGVSSLYGKFENQRISRCRSP